MNLVTTSQTLRIVLGEAKTTTDCDITTSYADTGFASFTLGGNDLTSNGTTAVTVVAAPSTGQQRQVKEVRLYNNDTVSHTVTLQLHYSSTTRVIQSEVVAAGGEFFYTPGAASSSAAVIAFEWNAGTVDVVGAGLAINGTDTLNAQWSAGTASAIGAGLSLSVAGTLSNTGILSLTGGTGVTISGGNTITNSGIVSLTGGTGITISGGNTVVNAGIVSLVGGTNVTISGGNTIAAASGIGSLVAGSGISISGSNTITNSGILSLVAGSNVTISGGNTIAAAEIWNAGTVTAVASNQMTDSGGTLAFVTGPTIQATQSTSPVVVNSNTSTAYPTITSNSGFVIVGADNMGNALEMIAVAGTLTGNSGNATTVLGRINGTLGSPSALGANDRVAGNSIRGWATSYVASMSYMNVFAGSTWTGSNNEYYLTLGTIPNGSTTVTERVRLLSGGAVLIGTTAATGSEKLNVHGDIVSSGTATLAGIIINAGSVITNAVGPGLANSSGTLQALVGHALAVNSGTIQDQNQGTITLSGTTTGTINPAGIDSCIVNVGTANGTLDISPGFQGQRLRIEIKMGATAHTVSLVSPDFSFGTDITSFTATASANARDIIQTFCMDGTHWGVGAIAHGFTI